MVRETRHLWVGNLPDNIREDRIREHFKRYGRVQSVKLLPPRHAGPGAGAGTAAAVAAASAAEDGAGLCAAVAFMDIKSASKAHTAEHKLDERCLTTEYYEPPAAPATLVHIHDDGLGAAVSAPSVGGASGTAPLYPPRSPRFPHGPGAEEAFERSSHFYRGVPVGGAAEGEAAVYLRRGPAYHASDGSGLRGRARDRLYRNGPYPPHIETGGRGAGGGSHHRGAGGGSGGGAWNYEGGRYPAAPAEPPAFPEENVPPVAAARLPPAAPLSPAPVPAPVPPPVAAPTPPAHLNSTSARKSKRAKHKRGAGVVAGSGSESDAHSSGRGSRSSSRSSCSSSHSGSSSSSSGSSRSRSQDSSKSCSPSGRPRRYQHSSHHNNLSSHSNPSTHADDRRPLAICVRNLPARSSDTSLKDGLFHEYKKHGKVTWVKVVGQGGERYAVVCFKKPEDVEKALEVSQDKLFFGCKIDVAPYEDFDVDDNDFRPYEAELDEFHPKATRTLFIGNLEKDITASELRKHFEQFGEIIEIDIKKQGSVSSYAFCQYADIGSVVKAMRNMDGEHLGNNRIKLGFGKSMPTNCVWVDGVSESVSENYLNMQFHQFGPIMQIAVDRERGHALVFFDQLSCAQNAVKEMRGAALRGRKLQIDFASRECQEAFYTHLETQGHATPADRPWERREPSIEISRETPVKRFEAPAVTPPTPRFPRYEGAAGRARGSHRGGAVAGTQRTSPANYTGTPRPGRQARYPAEFYEEFPERRFRTDDGSQGSGAHDDSYEQELREYGYSQRERRDFDPDKPGFSPAFHRHAAGDDKSPSPASLHYEEGEELGSATAARRHSRQKSSSDQEGFPSQSPPREKRYPYARLLSHSRSPGTPVLTSPLRELTPVTSSYYDDKDVNAVIDNNNPPVSKCKDNNVTTNSTSNSASSSMPSNKCDLREPLSATTTSEGERTSRQHRYSGASDGSGGKEGRRHPHSVQERAPSLSESDGGGSSTKNNAVLSRLDGGDSATLPPPSAPLTEAGGSEIKHLQKERVHIQQLLEQLGESYSSGDESSSAAVAKRLKLNSVDNNKLNAQGSDNIDKSDCHPAASAATFRKVEPRRLSDLKGRRISTDSYSKLSSSSKEDGDSKYLHRDYAPHFIPKRRKTESSSENEERIGFLPHRLREETEHVEKVLCHRDSSDSSRPGTPLCDERPENLPTEPRRQRDKSTDGPLSLPLPRFAHQILSPRPSPSQPGKVMYTIKSPPPAGPRLRLEERRPSDVAGSSGGSTGDAASPSLVPLSPQRPDSSSESENSARASPTLEERIRMLDEKYEKWSGSRTLSAALSSEALQKLDAEKFKLRTKMLDLNELRSQPSEIVRSVLAKRSVFDEDTKRLENYSEKYEAKDFASVARNCRTVVFTPNSVSTTTSSSFQNLKTDVKEGPNSWSGNASTLTKATPSSVISSIPLPCSSPTALPITAPKSILITSRSIPVTPTTPSPTCKSPFLTAAPTVTTPTCKSPFLTTTPTTPSPACKSPFQTAAPTIPTLPVKVAPVAQKAIVTPKVGAVPTPASTSPRPNSAAKGLQYPFPSHPPVASSGAAAPAVSLVTASQLLSASGVRNSLTSCQPPLSSPVQSASPAVSSANISAADLTASATDWSSRLEASPSNIPRSSPTSSYLPTPPPSVCGSPSVCKQSPPPPDLVTATPSSVLPGHQRESSHLETTPEIISSATSNTPPPQIPNKTVNKKENSVITSILKDTTKSCAIKKEIIVNSTSSTTSPSSSLISATITTTVATTATKFDSSKDKLEVINNSINRHLVRKESHNNSNIVTTTAAATATTNTTSSTPTIISITSTTPSSKKEGSSRSETHKSHKSHSDAKRDTPSTKSHEMIERKDSVESVERRRESKDSGKDRRECLSRTPSSGSSPASVGCKRRISSQDSAESVGSVSSDPRHRNSKEPSAEPFEVKQRNKEVKETTAEPSDPKKTPSTTKEPDDTKHRNPSSREAESDTRHKNTKDSCNTKDAEPSDSRHRNPKDSGSKEVVEASESRHRNPGSKEPSAEPSDPRHRSSTKEPSSEPEMKRPKLSPSADSKDKSRSQKPPDRRDSKDGSRRMDSKRSEERKSDRKHGSDKDRKPEEKINSKLPEEKQPHERKHESKSSSDGDKKKSKEHSESKPQDRDSKESGERHRSKDRDRQRKRNKSERDKESPKDHENPKVKDEKPVSLNKTKEEMEEEEYKQMKRESRERRKNREDHGDLSDEKNKISKREKKNERRKEEELKKRKERPKKLESGGSDSDLSEDGRMKKHSIFDIVDDEPAYISMYDKVKARSTKNMQKQEEEKQKEKLKEKFNQLKQSRAKREEKKRSTSWDEDSDSDNMDRDRSKMSKRSNKLVITSSSEDESCTKSEKSGRSRYEMSKTLRLSDISRDASDKSDSDMESSSRRKQRRSRNKSDGSDDEGSARTKFLRKSFKPKITSDTSDYEEVLMQQHKHKTLSTFDIYSDSDEKQLPTSTPLNTPATTKQKSKESSRETFESSDEGKFDSKLFDSSKYKNEFSENEAPNSQPTERIHSNCVDKNSQRKSHKKSKKRLSSKKNCINDKVCGLLEVDELEVRLERLEDTHLRTEIAELKREDSHKHEPRPEVLDIKREEPRPRLDDHKDSRPRLDSSDYKKEPRPEVAEHKRDESRPRPDSTEHKREEKDVRPRLEEHKREESRPRSEATDHKREDSRPRLDSAEQKRDESHKRGDEARPRLESTEHKRHTSKRERKKSGHKAEEDKSEQTKTDENKDLHHDNKANKIRKKKSKKDAHAVIKSEPSNKRDDKMEDIFGPLSDDSETGQQQQTCHETSTKSASNNNQIFNNPCPKKWQVSFVYSSDSDIDSSVVNRLSPSLPGVQVAPERSESPVTCKVDPSEGRRHSEERRRRRERKTKERRDKKMVRVKSEQPDTAAELDDLAKAGRALESKLLNEFPDLAQDPTTRTSSQENKPEGGSFDVFRFTDDESIESFEKPKEKKKKRKKSKEEKSRKDHHDKSRDDHERKNSRSDELKLQLPVSLTSPKSPKRKEAQFSPDQNSKSFNKHNDRSEDSHHITEIEIRPSTKVTELPINKYEDILLPTIIKNEKKKPEKLIPGFGKEVDATIHESAVKSICKFEDVAGAAAAAAAVASLPTMSEEPGEEKPRTVISQEETEDAVAALLEETFDFRRYSDEGEPPILDSLPELLAEEAHKETQQAVESLECEMPGQLTPPADKTPPSIEENKAEERPDTPQSEHDLQIDEEAHCPSDDEDHFAGLRFDEPPKTPDINLASSKTPEHSPRTPEIDFSRPPKTPDFPAAYYQQQQEKQAAEAEKPTAVSEFVSTVEEEDEPIAELIEKPSEPEVPFTSSTHTVEKEKPSICVTETEVVEKTICVPEPETTKPKLVSEKVEKESSSCLSEAETPEKQTLSILAIELTEKPSLCVTLSELVEKPAVVQVSEPEAAKKTSDFIPAAKVVEKPSPPAPVTSLAKKPSAVTHSITQTITRALSPALMPTVSRALTPTVTVTPTVSRAVTPTVTVTPTVSRAVTPTVTPALIKAVAPTITPAVARAVTPAVIPTVSPAATRAVTPAITPTVKVTQLAVIEKPLADIPVVEVSEKSTVSVLEPVVAEETTEKPQLKQKLEPEPKLEPKPLKIEVEEIKTEVVEAKKVVEVMETKHPSVITVAPPKEISVPVKPVVRPPTPPPLPPLVSEKIVEEPTKSLPVVEKEPVIETPKTTTTITPKPTIKTDESKQVEIKSEPVEKAVAEVPTPAVTAVVYEAPQQLIRLPTPIVKKVDLSAPVMRDLASQAKQDMLMRPEQTPEKIKVEVPQPSSPAPDVVSSPVTIKAPEELKVEQVEPTAKPSSPVTQLSEQVVTPEKLVISDVACRSTRRGGRSRRGGKCVSRGGVSTRRSAARGGGRPAREVSETTEAKAVESHTEESTEEKSETSPEQRGRKSRRGRKKKSVDGDDKNKLHLRSSLEPSGDIYEFHDTDDEDFHFEAKSGSEKAASPPAPKSEPERPVSPVPEMPAPAVPARRESVEEAVSRPRLILTIKSPMKESAKVETREEFAKVEEPPEPVPETKTEPESSVSSAEDTKNQMPATPPSSGGMISNVKSPPPGPVRKSRRLQEKDSSRNTVDDIIEEVIRGNFKTEEESPVSPMGTRTTRRSVRGRHHDDSSERKLPRVARGTSLKPEEEQPEKTKEKVAEIEEVVKVVTSEAATPVTAPIPTPKPILQPSQVIRTEPPRAIGPQTGPHNRPEEPTTLIDPVTGLLIPMRESEEGQYIPVTSAGGQNAASGVAVTSASGQTKPILSTTVASSVPVQSKVPPPAVSAPCAVVSVAPVVPTTAPPVSTGVSVIQAAESVPRLTVAPTKSRDASPGIISGPAVVPRPSVSAPVAEVAPRPRPTPPSTATSTKSLPVNPAPPAVSVARPAVTAASRQAPPVPRAAASGPRPPPPPLSRQAPLPSVVKMATAVLPSQSSTTPPTITVAKVQQPFIGPAERLVSRLDRAAAMAPGAPYPPWPAPATPSVIAGVQQPPRPEAPRPAHLNSSPPLSAHVTAPKLSPKTSQQAKPQQQVTIPLAHCNSVGGHVKLLEHSGLGKALPGTVPYHPQPAHSAAPQFSAAGYERREAVPHKEAPGEEVCMLPPRLRVGAVARTSAAAALPANTGASEPPKVDVNMSGCIVAPPRSGSRESPARMHSQVLQAGMPVPAYEASLHAAAPGAGELAGGGGAARPSPASYLLPPQPPPPQQQQPPPHLLGQVIERVPNRPVSPPPAHQQGEVRVAPGQHVGGFGAPPHHLRPPPHASAPPPPHEMAHHLLHPQLFYQQLMRAQHEQHLSHQYHLPPGAVRSPAVPGLDSKAEQPGASDEAVGAQGSSPPLELRRPASRGNRLAPPPSAHLHSPHDRSTDSPQVATVYGARLVHHGFRGEAEKAHSHLAHHAPQPRGFLQHYEEEFRQHPPPAHHHRPGGVSAPHTRVHPIPGSEAPPTQLQQQSRLQVQTPPHASQVPPQADSLLMLLQRYPVMWQGLLALKNDQAAVQMHFVYGNPDVARDSLPCNSDGSTPPLRIAQRMRLEQTQVEGVARKMQMENEHCMLLALPCGRDHMDVLQQSNNLQTGFITYLQQKQAAGIVNIAAPGSQQAAYVVHIFPSCEFANDNLARIAPDLLHRVADIAHLLIIIATV